jgi:hypothetical protein
MTMKNTIKNTILVCLFGATVLGVTFASLPYLDKSYGQKLKRDKEFVDKEKVRLEPESAQRKKDDDDLIAVRILNILIQAN